MEKTVYKNTENQKRTHYRIAANRIRNAAKTIKRLANMKDQTEAQNISLEKALEVSRDTELKAVVHAKKDEYKHQNREGNLAKAGKDKTAEEK